MHGQSVNKTVHIWTKCNSNECICITNCFILLLNSFSEMAINFGLLILVIKLYHFPVNLAIIITTYRKEHFVLCCKAAMQIKVCKMFVSLVPRLSGGVLIMRGC